MQDGWRPRFVSIVEAMIRDSSIKVHKVAFADPATQDEIAAAIALMNGAIPAGTAEFYEEMNGFSLEWQSNIPHSDGQTVRGSINLLPITQVFGSWQGATWSPETAEVRYQPVKPFDLFAPEACSAFYLPRGKTDSMVYFHYFGEALVNTYYTFTEYLERLLVSRGYWYWIQSLCEDCQINPEVQSFRNNMPRIFPDYKDTLFRPK